MFNPVSTYRIQFHKDFTFGDFLAVVPYLHDLGIRTIYASPIYQAVPGSMHGYDVVDPNKINPEIGTLAELREISALLKSYQMSWVQDLVPNHMGFHHQNTWLMDVLKNGENSAYRKYFDFVSKDLRREPLMVPFLGNDLETTIENGELELINQNGVQYFKYFDNLWPVRDNLEKGATKISELVKGQYYRLCSHTETDSNINYRRFFTVNSLICLNMQHQEVFDDYHRLTKTLLDEGVFQGLRIDHVDGLYDPSRYLKQLRALSGADTYIVVEKILEPGEQLPPSWPVQGTTGYDYLGLTNQLFTNQKAARKFDSFYKELGHGKRPVYQQVLTKKRAFLDQYMQGELDNLHGLLNDLKLPCLPEFRQLIAEVLVRMPVYRLYGDHYPLQVEESEVLDAIFEELKSNVDYTASLPIFRDLLLGRDAGDTKDDPAILFFKRLMQFSGPLMAKGVEDTLMYTYNRFIGNNEVGDSPEVFGITTADFLEQLSVRAKSWPYAMNATATHDTKRGEDARTRLSVLTDLKAEWLAEVTVWQELNQDRKTGDAPDANDEYFIYQTLVATCPEAGGKEDNYETRLLDYVEKALRESKRNSQWNTPDLEYEASTRDFVRSLLNPSHEFWIRFSGFLNKVAAFGKLVSLSSLVLKHTLPGIPDTYQGTELWDLSLVDPDNRRPVDYKLSAELLKATSGAPDKIQLLARLLQLRNRYPDLFSKGQFFPLGVKGKYSAHIIAYARVYKGNWLLVAAAVNLPALVATPAMIGAFDWQDTQLELPKALDRPGLVYKDALKEKTITEFGTDPGETATLPVADFLSGRSFAACTISIPRKIRGAGILMHLSSLPSAYGVGDFGPAATQFISFLADSGLKYWQVLPMNPSTAEQAYSPYSATSVMAGNTLLISPELLAEAGVLDPHELRQYVQKTSGKVNFPKVAQLKDKLLKRAFKNWKTRDTAIQVHEFEAFCTDQADWLEDYALFSLIGTLEQDKPWYQWKPQLKKREPAALNAIRHKYTTALEEIRWQQFIFFRQWNTLKQLANTMGIEIIGDLPFYAAHHSADVWANPKLFSLDAEGAATGMAGVPPDYFNSDGQLWGMPVYQWKVMARNGYKWWTDRISRNLNWYDRLRLDHFRAFSDYWLIPAGSETAKSGKWMPGPGAAFFKALKSVTGDLPLIAEDLGEISPEVYRLRDEFSLPGMKVLQFAFGTDTASTIHAPHCYTTSNCVVYTGTHDNNTTRGWYTEEADETTRKRLESYVGTSINKKNVAKEMVRLALSTTADIAIVPMQDLLQKSSGSRMNVPASVGGNWAWRLKPDELSADVAIRIRKLLELYGR